MTFMTSLAPEVPFSNGGSGSCSSTYETTPRSDSTQALSRRRTKASWKRSSLNTEGAAHIAEVVTH